MNKSKITSMLLLVASFAQGTWAQAQRYAPAGDSFKTPVLKKIDKVELLSIYSRMGNIERVDATKSLEGQQAEQIAVIWRKQKFREYSPAVCHQPPYALKFYSKGKMVLFATICWACRNVTFLVPETKHWVRFDGESKEAQELREVFAKAFPGEKKFGD